jgi:hypothetical protein
VALAAVLTYPVSGQRGRANVRKGFLIAGTVIGAFVIAFGLLALFGSLADATSQRSDEVTGSLVILVAGAVISIPCGLGLLLGRREQSFSVLSAAQQKSPPLQTRSATPQSFASDVAANYALASYPPATGARSTRDMYKQWHNWARGWIGNDSVRVHAAATAAVQAMMSGADPETAARAARDAAARN